MSSGENHIVDGEGPCDPAGKQQDNSSDPSKDSLTEAAPDGKKAKTLDEESTDPTDDPATPTGLITADINNPQASLSEVVLPLTSAETEQDKNGNTESPMDNSAVGASSLNEDTIKVKVAYNKTIYETVISKSQTVQDLKYAVQKSTGVPESLQKLMYKGKLNDNSKIADTSLVDGCKVLLVGSKVSDVVQVNKVPTKRELMEDTTETKSSEPLCQQTQHKKVIDKGKPDSVMIGIKNSKEALPPTPLSGMIKQDGGPVRLTFKLETDELWIGTKERTHKLPMNSIKRVHSEPITDQEEYSIVGIQTGPTAKSIIWVYWVPSQYIDAIKDTILGSFLF